MQDFVQENGRLRLVFIFEPFRLVDPLEDVIDFLVYLMRWVLAFELKDVVHTLGDFFQELRLGLFGLQNLSLFDTELAIKLLRIEPVEWKDLLPEVRVVDI